LFTATTSRPSSPDPQDGRKQTNDERRPDGGSSPPESLDGTSAWKSSSSSEENPYPFLEEKWNIPAEVILEAIARSQDITLRGIRGVIAELCFLLYVLEGDGLQSNSLEGTTRTTS
jgi:hypothetical protein